MAIKIYIDQGHNPQNPNAGAEGNGFREQDLTFEVGLLLADFLNANPNYEARVSRPTPETVLGTSNVTSLRARVDDANAWGADYFISLHMNAAESPLANGAEAFVYQPMRLQAISCAGSGMIRASAAAAFSCAPACMYSEKR